jgi:hypothetical protein
MNTTSQHINTRQNLLFWTQIQNIMSTQTTKDNNSQYSLVKTYTSQLNCNSLAFADVSAYSGWKECQPYAPSSHCFPPLHLYLLLLHYPQADLRELTCQTPREENTNCRHCSSWHTSYCPLFKLTHLLLSTVQVHTPPTVHCSSWHTSYCLLFKLTHLLLSTVQVDTPPNVYCSSWHIYCLLFKLTHLLLSTVQVDTPNLT